MRTFIKDGRMKTTATRKISIYQKVFILVRLIRYRDPLTLGRLFGSPLYWLLHSLLFRFLGILAQAWPSPSPFPSFILATTTSILRARSRSKTPFSISNNRGSRWRRLTNLPVNSALMLETLAKLFFFLSGSKISLATSFEVRFSRSIYARWCNLFSLFFPPFFCFLFFLRDWRLIPMRLRLMMVAVSLFYAWNELVDVLTQSPLLISQQVVFFIGRGFNLDDKGDRTAFGFKYWKYPMAMPFCGGWERREIMKPSTTDKGVP